MARLFLPSGIGILSISVDPQLLHFFNKYTSLQWDFITEVEFWKCEVPIMLKEIIRKRYPVSDKLIEITLDAATQDIKFNRIFFHRRTTLPEVLRIVELCLVTAKRLDI